MNRLIIALFVIFAAAPQISLAQDITCTNPGKKVFKKKADIKAPDETRTVGVKIRLNGVLADVPDTKPECLPISLRYNNPGALQTRKKAGYWDGQINKDAKGHAVFNSLEDGIAAWALWLRTRVTTRPNLTARDMMNIYAPANDCIGTVQKLANGKCPPGFPLNPTKEYAERIGKAVGKGPDEPLDLRWNDCLEQRTGLFAAFREIMTFEAGSGFCGKGGCSVDRATFERAVDRVAGPIDWSRCGPEARERYLEDI